MRLTTKIGAVLTVAALAGGAAVAESAQDSGGNGASDAECMQLKRDINAAMEAGAAKQDLVGRFGDRMAACNRAQPERKPAHPGGGVDKPQIRETAECRAKREEFDAAIKREAPEAELRRLKQAMADCFTGPKDGGCAARTEPGPREDDAPVRES